MSNFKELMKHLSEHLSDKDENRKVVKTLPMKPSWQKLFDEKNAAIDEAREAKQKASSLNDLFWATIRKETGEYKSMGIDTKNNELKIYAEEEDEE